MRDTLFFVVLLGFASGIFLRSFFVWELPVVVWLLLVALAIGVLSRRASFARAPLYCSIALVAVALGMFRFEVATWSMVVPTLAAQVGTDSTLTGVVVREPDVRARSQHLYVELAEHNTLLLVVADRYESVAYGDRLTLTGRLEQPTTFTTDLGRTFDYPGFLRARGVAYILRYPEAVQVVAHGQANWFIAWLLQGKHAFQQSVRQFIPSPQIGLAEGLLLGEKQALGNMWNELFRRTGIIHIVVLSGYNVMLVIGFFLFVLSWFCSVRARAVGALVGVVCFALIVGLSATVTRASLMAGLLLLALMLGRSYAILRALLLAGAIMLMINPYLLVFDPGFQLSFLATLGLIVVAPYFESLLVVGDRALTVRDYVIATVATQIAVLPLLLYQVGELSIVAVLVNLLVLPIVPVAMLLTFLTGIVGFVSPLLGSLFGYLTYWSLQYILAIVAYIGNWPLAAVTVPTFSGWWVLLAYAVMGYWWYRRSIQSETGPTIVAQPATPEPGMGCRDWTIVEVTETKAGLVRRTNPAKARNIFLP